MKDDKALDRLLRKASLELEQPPVDLPTRIQSELRHRRRISRFTAVAVAASTIAACLVVANLNTAPSREPADRVDMSTTVPQADRDSGRRQSNAGSLKVVTVNRHDTQMAQVQVPHEFIAVPLDIPEVDATFVQVFSVVHGNGEIP